MPPPRSTDASVRALPASSPMPWTRLTTPAGSPARVSTSCISSTRIAADSGLHSAGLWTTVHPAASAGRDLPRGQHERRVPGRDDADRSDRRAHRVVHVRVGRKRQSVACAGRAIGEEAEVLRGAQRGLAHVADWLARVDALDQRNLLRSHDDGVGDLVQQTAPRLAIDGAPGGKCGACGARGAIDVVGIAASDRAQRRVIGRRQVVEGACRFRGQPARRCGAVPASRQVAPARARQPRDWRRTSRQADSSCLRGGG